jgi:ketosteroid isomerase-like protein
VALAEPIKIDPVEIAVSFIRCINLADVPGLYELMTEDHVFQDALGKRFVGRDPMRQGWTQYFALVHNYKIFAQEYFVHDLNVAIFGTASGTYAHAGKGIDAFWEVPAAWNVLVRGKLVAEWRVYADNQPLRKLMGEKIP